MKSLKKIIASIGAVAFVLYGIFSCDLVPIDGVASASVSDWTGSTVNRSYTGSNVQYELPANTRTVNLTVNGPVEIFMAKMNVGTQVVPAVSTRYIVSAGRAAVGRSAVGDSAFLNDLDTMDSAAFSANIDSLPRFGGIVREDFAPARDFVPPVLPAQSESASVRSASGNGDSPLYSTVQARTAQTASVGTTDSLWVDLPTGGVDSKRIDGTTYTKQPATVRAIGDYCNVWVVDSYFTEGTASGAKVNPAQAQALADTFDKMYTGIREVFGNEADHITDSQTGTQIPPRHSKVNIVVYDIGGDYSSNQHSGVVGYFWGKDYYTAAGASSTSSIMLSNEGKYFYADSGFLNMKAGGSVNGQQLLYSTMAHEFQHMIRFANKPTAAVWYTEMLSMVCEDMVQGFLGIDDSSSPIGTRLYDFCGGYYLSGLTDWYSGGASRYSYGVTYAFGAYLARNYGGKDLIREIATNSTKDIASIDAALQKVAGETFDSVFKKYVQALLLDNPSAGANIPTFNKSEPGIGGNMKAIDIFHVGGSSSTVRPVVLKSDAASRQELRPYGFSLHGVGYTESAGTVQLDFSSPVYGDDEKVYILVQPAY